MEAMSARERLLYQQVEAGLRAHSVDLSLLDAYRERHVAVFWRGYRVIREQSMRIFGEQPAFLFASLAPEDAGVGFSMQRAIYAALGGRAFATTVAPLGAVYNAIIGLIDKLTDNFPEWLPSLQSALTPASLAALLTLKHPIPLPRPPRPAGASLEGSSRIDLLLTLIEDYVDQAATLARRAGRSDVWRDFQTLYLDLMRHQFASAALANDDCPASADALQTAIGRTAPTLWAYFINAWLAPDTRAPTDRARVRSAVDRWGEAVVLSEDLCDLVADTEEGRWNTVTLLATLRGYVPLTQRELREQPDVVLDQLLAAEVPKWAASDMCERFSSAFAQFEALAPGCFASLANLGQEVLCYPLFAPQLSQSKRVMSETAVQV